MERRPESYPGSNLALVLRKVVGGAAAYKTPEEFMVDLVRKVDPSDSGCASFD